MGRARSQPDLSAAERQRYLRHLLLPEVGVEGQKRLAASSVLVVGAGGLGSPAALYLAAAGVGTIGLVDFDKVDATNLQRQILYDDNSVGRNKVEAARERLLDLNPLINVVAHECRLSAANAISLVGRYDLVLDGTDSFAARYLVNDACVLLGTPNVHGAIFRFEGQVTVYWPPEGPCYRCLFPEPPPADAVPNCAEAGVLGVLPGVIGCLQTVEALKILLRIGEPLIGRLLLYDALAARFREVRVPRAADCPLCGESPTIRKVEEPPDSSCASSMTDARKDASLETPLPDILPEELHKRLKAGEDLFILDVRQPEEYAICKIAGSTLIPLGELPNRLRELDPEREIIVHCKAGGRSSQAVAFLRQQGFANVRNVPGGILAWADKVDPTITKY
jgi:adenylyltransferase/sulfurtransferase